MANETTLNAFYTQANGNLNSKLRVVGAGNTAITFGDTLVILCKSINIMPPQLASNYSAIQGIGDQRPVAILPSNVQKEGRIDLEIWEKYPNAVDGYTFWQQELMNCFPNSEYNLSSITSIAALMAYQRTNPEFVNNFTVRMYMENPTYTNSGTRVAGKKNTVRSFMNPVITNVDYGEQIDNTKIEKSGKMTITYTHDQWDSAPTGLSVVSVKD